jgi:hypothetical protein
VPTKYQDDRAKALKREEMTENPFDPRTEVSADARHIAMHLWILFALLPVVAALLLWLLRYVMPLPPLQSWLPPCIPSREPATRGRP